jgi:uncharacterized membrane protein
VECFLQFLFSWFGISLTNDDESDRLCIFEFWSVKHTSSVWLIWVYWIQRIFLLARRVLEIFTEIVKNRKLILPFLLTFDFYFFSMLLLIAKPCLKNVSFMRETFWGDELIFKWCKKYLKFCSFISVFLRNFLLFYV